MNAEPYDERAQALALDEYCCLMKEAGKKESDPEYLRTLSQLGQSKKVDRLN